MSWHIRWLLLQDSAVVSLVGTKKWLSCCLRVVLAQLFFFSEGIWGMETLSFVTLLWNGWLLAVYSLLFTLLMPASQKQSLGPNLFSELAVSPACTPKSFCFSHRREYMQPAKPQWRTCQRLKISFLTLVSRANLKGKLKHSRELKEIPVSWKCLQGGEVVSEMPLYNYTYWGYSLWFLGYSRAWLLALS